MNVPKKTVSIYVFAMLLLPGSGMAQTALERQATEAFQNEDYAGAANLFGQLVQADPHNPESWYFLGRSLQGINDIEGARAAYKQVRNISPDGGIAKTATRWLARLPLPSPTPAQLAERRAQQARVSKKLAAAAGAMQMVAIPDRDFEIGKHDVTVAQFAQFVSETGYRGNDVGCDWQDPGFDQAANHPVVCVSWNDANAYAQWLSQKTGERYRLPTEAEWQYACCGDSATESGGIQNIDAVAWYRDNSDGGTHPVGQKQANAYGLHDMSGNVWQWMQDLYDEDRDWRVLRGGAWNSRAQGVRVAFRFSYRLSPSKRYSTNGFRLVKDRS